jgi:hypothetical protein
VKGERLFTAIGQADEELLDRYHRSLARQVHPWRRWAAMAACACLLIATVQLLPSMMSGGSTSSDCNMQQSTTSGGGSDSGSSPSSGEQGNDTSGETNPGDGSTSNGSEIPRWEDRSLTERFSQLEWEGKTYTSDEATLEKAQLGETLGHATLTGYDPYTQQTYQWEAKLYAIQGINPQCAVAVWLEGEDAPHPYINSSYRPETLGEFCEALSLHTNLEFGRVWKDSSTLVQEDADDEAIWALLDQWTEAPNEWDDADPRFYPLAVDIGVDLPLLGIHNVSMGVTTNGYLTTNLLATGKGFFIGPEAAEELIQLLLD